MIQQVLRKHIKDLTDREDKIILQVVFDRTGVDAGKNPEQVIDRCHIKYYQDRKELYIDNKLALTMYITAANLYGSSFDFGYETTTSFNYKIEAD